MIGAVLMSGIWKPGIEFDVLGTPLELQNLLRDVALVAIAGCRWRSRRSAARQATISRGRRSSRSAKLFAGIFITIMPVIAMLRAGKAGALAPLVRARHRCGRDSRTMSMYFWLTGALSSFLDNAPTYLVFFNLAGGDAAQLMTPLAPTLAAISAAPCSWAPTPTSATRPTSWSRRSPKSAASACPASSATWPGRGCVLGPGLRGC